MGEPESTLPIYDEVDDFNHPLHSDYDTEQYEAATVAKQIGFTSPTGVEGDPVFYGGAVFTWGVAFNGELGHNEYTTKGICPVPRQVPGLHSIVQVGCGEGYTAALRSDGTVYTWGQGYKCGLGIDGDVFEPQRVEGLRGLFIKSIACGEYHMAAIEQSEGSLFTWGKGTAGALGTGTDNKQLTPQKVVLEVTVSGRAKGHLKGVRSVDCGYSNTAAIMENGELWVWGAGSDGRLGLGKLQQRVWVPKRIELASDGEAMPKVSMVSMGSWHCGCVSEDGAVYMWGRGEWGNLGTGKRVRVALSPTLVKGDLEGQKVREVHCSTGQINPVVGPGQDGLHTVAITERGEVYTWGTGYKGQLGNLWRQWTMNLKGKEDELLPYHVGSATRDTRPLGDGKIPDSRYLYGEPMVKACAAPCHSMVLSAGGRMYSFGCGDEGRLGLQGFLQGGPGSGSNLKLIVSQPSLIEELWECGAHVKDMATSQRHAAVVVL